MAIDAYCPEIIEVDSFEELQTLTSLADYYVLGEGSNTLFTENEAPKLIRPKLLGIAVEETAEDYLLTVQAGENWQKLVTYTVEHGMPGLENLALIPGSVGAAPIQNIGAYGVEFADFCQAVHWYDFKSNQVTILAAYDCQFGYRDSVFKRQLKGQGIIVAVELKLSKAWQPSLGYAGLNQLPECANALEVMNTVMAIRSSKLPNPEELPNAGSFFKNPIINCEEFKRLKQQYPDIPNYPQPDDQVKIAAGWLIEQAQLKGFRLGDAGVHSKQALVLVNYGNAKGEDIVALARHVIGQVQEKFSITLEPEVRLVAALGERAAAEIFNHV